MILVFIQLVTKVIIHGNIWFVSNHQFYTKKHKIGKPGIFKLLVIARNHFILAIFCVFIKRNQFKLNTMNKSFLMILTLCTYMYHCSYMWYNDWLVHQSEWKKYYNFGTTFWDSGHSESLCKSLHIAHAHCKSVGFFLLLEKDLEKIIK